MTHDKKMLGIKTKSEETRQRILDCAARCFREHGYSVRLTDIAEMAGVKTGSLYYYFNGREDLVEEVLQVGLRMNIDYIKRSLEDLLKEATSLDRLRTAVRADAEVLMEISDYGAAYNRVFSVLPDDRKKHLHAARMDLGGLLLQLYKDAQRDGYVRPGLDLKTIHLLVFGSIRWTTEWYRPDRGRSAELVIDQLVHMVMQGIEAPK
jgi:TetR/AcrR family transcriptional regulator, cholesterol catabolism regulator